MAWSPCRLFTILSTLPGSTDLGASANGKTFPSLSLSASLPSEPSTPRPGYGPPSTNQTCCPLSFPFPMRLHPPPRRPDAQPLRPAPTCPFSFPSLSPSHLSVCVPLRFPSSNEFGNNGRRRRSKLLLPAAWHVPPSSSTGRFRFSLASSRETIPQGCPCVPAREVTH